MSAHTAQRESACCFFLRCIVSSYAHADVYKRTRLGQLQVVVVVVVVVVLVVLVVVVEVA